jgi:hypothetical protein
MRPTICHTCMMLSSDTLATTQGSLLFHEKSEIFDVCPPWTNYTSLHRKHTKNFKHSGGKEVKQREAAKARVMEAWPHQELRGPVLSILRALLGSDFATGEKRQEER